MPLNKYDDVTVDTTVAEIEALHKINLKEITKHLLTWLKKAGIVIVGFTGAAIIGLGLSSLPSSPPCSLPTPPNTPTGASKQQGGGFSL